MQSVGIGNNFRAICILLKENLDSAGCAYYMIQHLFRSQALLTLGRSSGVTDTVEIKHSPYLNNSSVSGGL